MIPAITLPRKSSQKLRLVPARQKNETSGWVGPQEKGMPDRPIKNIKPQQLIAGMAFRMLGLDAKQIYKANTALLGGVDYSMGPFIELGYSDQANTIAQAAQLLRVFVQNNEVVENGNIQRNRVSDYLCELVDAGDDADVIVFSKTYNGKQIIVVYNTSETEAEEKFILLDNKANANVKILDTIYGYEACGHTYLFHGKHNGEDIAYLKIYLKPMHLVILKNY